MFEIVDRKILLEFLHQLGLRCIARMSTQTANVTRGILQGSVLGPLLYCMFVYTLSPYDRYNKQYRFHLLASSTA